MFGQRIVVHESKHSDLIEHCLMFRVELIPQPFDHYCAQLWLMSCVELMLSGPALCGVAELVLTYAQYCLIFSSRLMT